MCHEFVFWGIPIFGLQRPKDPHFKGVRRDLGKQACAPKTKLKPIHDRSIPGILAFDKQLSAEKPPEAVFGLKPSKGLSFNG